MIVHARDVAHVPEVDGVGPRAGHHLGRALLGLDDARARAVETHRTRTRGDERRAQIDVHLAGDGHLHHVERRVVGDAAAGDDVGRLAESLLEVRRLRSAAVHDDDRRSGGHELREIGGDRREVRPGHDLTAELEDERMLLAHG